MNKRALEYLPILTIIFIYFAYCNLHYYYSEFHIEIYNYVSNTEILVSFLPTIVVFTSFFSFVFIQFLIDEKPAKAFIADSNQIQTDTLNKFWKFVLSPATLIILAWILNSGIMFLLIDVFSYKEYELKNYNLLMGILLPCFVYFVYSKRKINYDIDKIFLPKYSFILLILMIFYLGSQIGRFRKSEADELKDTKNHHQMVLYFKNAKVATNNNLIFVGQTQSTIFLYNKKDASTHLYSKTNIDSAQIKYIP